MNYQKIYNCLIERARNRELDDANEVHHILPRCLGGTDLRDNLVELTPEEHYVAHQLLHRIYPDHYGLFYAAVKMCQGRPNNKLYGWLRRRLKERQSEKMAGAGNTMYGKRWVSNEKETLLLDELDAEHYVQTGDWISGKIAKRAPCGHLVRTRCKSCEDLKGKRKEIRRQEGQQLALDLYKEFVESDAVSICDFARKKNTSQPRLTMLWKKHIPDYKTTVAHGRSFKPKT